jgi:hypothetical protein
MAIAAVVETIDEEQRELHKRNNTDNQPFVGGFSIVPNAALIEALLEESAEGHDVASRPGRCWFMPLNMSGKLSDRAKNG